MKPRKVLHLVDTGGPGGAETVFLTLVLGLDPAAWSPCPVVPEVDWLDGELRRVGQSPTLLESSGSFDRRYLFRLRRLILEQEPAVIQTHLLTSAVYATLASAGLGIPVVSTFHGEPDIDPGDRWLWAKLRVLRGPRNRMVFVSEALRSHVTGLGSVHRSRTRVIHNGVDCSVFRPSEVPRAPIPGLDLPEGATVVGAVGNVRRSKDYGVLLRATADLVERMPDIHTVIVGQNTGSLFEDLLDLRTSLGLQDRVHFLGFREDVAELFRCFDVFALSSSDEGFSLATVQAMASGVPVVATRSGGPEEIVVDEQTGLLVPPRDPRALADGLARVLALPDGGRAWGAAGRDRAASTFSTGAMLKAYEGLYRELLGGEGA